jgi:tetratricopeptide (TPR) repeat protein
VSGDPTKLPPHPVVRAQRRTLLGITALGVVLGAAAVGSGVAWAAPAGLVVSAYFGWSLWALPRRARLVQLHNAALERVMRGREQEAEQLLDQIPARDLRRGSVARGAHVQRAQLALYQGDVERSIDLATVAVEMRPARWPVTQPIEQTQRAKALALRALAHASLGHEAPALQDAAAAETAPSATPDVLARASLARSVVLARNDKRHELAAALAQTAGLMLQWLPPRERSLVRALRRMARAPARSVYRQPAERDEGTEEAKLASWIGKLAPGAGAFVRETGSYSTSLLAGDPAPKASAEALRQVASSRKKATVARKALRPWVVLFLWVTLVALFFCIYQLLPAAGPSGAASALPTSPTAIAALVGAVFVALLVPLVVWQVRRQRADGRALSLAQLDVARSELAKATTAFEALSQPKRTIAVAAAAHLGLAQLAERRASWDDAIQHCDRGIARLCSNATLKAMHADLLYPELIALRAVALAAQGRSDEANAEASLLASECPGYVLGARARFSLGLMLAVRSGNLDAAAEVAKRRSPDLPLSLRDDMLADVVLAATTTVPPEERERIDAELHDDAELRAWVDAVAPGLRDRTAIRVATPATETAWEEEGAVAEVTLEGVAALRSGRAVP